MFVRPAAAAASPSAPARYRLPYPVAPLPLMRSAEDFICGANFTQDGRMVLLRIAAEVLRGGCPILVEPGLQVRLGRFKPVRTVLEQAAGDGKKHSLDNL